VNESAMCKEYLDQDISKPKRRRFLLWVIYSLPSLIAATIASSAARYLFGKPKISTSAWADAGDLAELQEKVPREVYFQHSVIDGWRLRTDKSVAWVVIDGRQQVTAFSPLCTHLGCAYRWRAERQAFFCPCHGSAFDLEGKVIAGPASRPLDRFSVKVEGSRLWLGPLRESKSS
jgi:menaquinol-cytochrome c reductase iron-sulfur subunit